MPDRSRPSQLFRDADGPGPSRRCPGPGRRCPGPGRRGAGPGRPRPEPGRPRPGPDRPRPHPRWQLSTGHTYRSLSLWTPVHSPLAGPPARSSFHPPAGAYRMRRLSYPCDLRGLNAFQLSAASRPPSPPPPSPPPPTNERTDGLSGYFGRSFSLI